MPLLDLDPDALLTTTRSVRLRLDLERPVQRHLIEECIEIAQQAPSGGNTQGWSFVVVTDPRKRQALGNLYRQGWEPYFAAVSARFAASENSAPDPGTLRVYRSARYLADHMGQVPVLVVPCIRGRLNDATTEQQAGFWGSILPATWSFMLAARARGLGTFWTTLHLPHEREAAELLGIPYAGVTQAALIPVAHTIGDEFKLGPRRPLESVVHWDTW